MNFVDMIFFYGAATPEKQAIILTDRIVSFAMLTSGIRSVESRLREFGLKPGQTAAIRIHSPIRHLIVLSALYRLGVVTISVAGGEDLAGSGVKLDATFTDGESELAWKGPVHHVQDEWFFHPVDPAAHSPGFADPDALCRIAMSSGTSAKPKAIGMSARVIEDRILTHRRTLALAPWDRMMCLPALASNLGFGSAVQALAYGHSICFAFSALETLQMIALYGADLLVANPQHLKELVAVHKTTRIPTPSLKLIKFGGNALAPALIPEVRARLCSNILCVYASTESGPIAFAPIEALLDAPGSTGFVAPWAEVEVLGEDGNALPAGEEGELRLRSEWQGYDLLAKTGGSEARQWVHPGDVGQVTSQGMLVLTGRSADLIKIGGKKISPDRIEQALSNCKGVDDCAVVGVPSMSGDDEIWVAVTSKGVVDPALIKAHLTQINPGWIVKGVKAIDAIPRNEMGKVMRRIVKEKLLGR